MFSLDIPPEYPHQSAPIVIAQSSDSERGPADVDRIIGVCAITTNDPDLQDTSFNVLTPVRVVRIYLSDLEKREIPFDGTAEVMEGPKHGSLEDIGEGSYVYHPTAGYVGFDHATILVETGGQTVKLMYLLNVSQGAPGGTEGYDPYRDKKYCPKGGLWEISMTLDGTTGALPSAWGSYTVAQ